MKLIDKVSVNNLIEAQESYGFKVFRGNNGRKDYDLNIVGIRAEGSHLSTFNDVMAVYWYYNNKWTIETFNVTTDPSIYWLRLLGNSKGTAILKHPQQVRGMYKIGYHKGKYKALVQNKSCVVWRDANKDDKLDFDVPEDYGIFGINIHRASKYHILLKIGAYSAGCQVHNDYKRYLHFLSLCDESAKIWGDSFTYTLLHESDL